jgi:hypothetical protein
MDERAVSVQLEFIDLGGVYPIHVVVHERVVFNK